MKPLRRIWKISKNKRCAKLAAASCLLLHIKRKNLAAGITVNRISLYYPNVFAGLIAGVKRYLVFSI
jgi:hypothetical protein